MFVMANFLFAIATVLDIVLTLYLWIIIARAIISWVIPFSRSPLAHTIAHGLARLTDPVLWRIQKFLPLRGMGLDISPLIAVLIIMFLKSFLVATLFDIARRLAA
jgi:YggT family protein